MSGISAAPSKTWDFESAEIPCTGASSQIFSAAHGLGVKPKMWAAFGICKTAVSGFSVGDEFIIASNMVTVVGARQSHSGVTANETDVSYAYSGYVPYTESPTGVAQFLDTNFSVILRAKK